MARPRNNVMRLDQATRLVIAQLLDDGQTYEAIRQAPEVAAACLERGVTLHNNSLRAYSETAEFGEYRKSVRRFAEDLERRRMAAFFIDQESGADSLARVANYELLRLVLAKLEAGDDLEAKELSSVSTALAAYERNRISAAKEDAKRDFAQREAEYQDRIQELQRQLNAARETTVTDPAKVADELNKLLGVKK